MRNLLYIFLLILSGAFIQGCISDDFTTSPGVRLKFSTDTVSFDTVFTDLGTPTARLKVFNPDKKSVNISSIRFRNPDSPFSMNVDGVSGYDFSNVEIRGGDSIFIFIECYLPENQDTRPFLVSDDLLFQLNGNEQSVRVEAYGQNVTRLRNAVIESDMTMTADRPYIIFDSLTIRKGATLRIQPGAMVLFHDKASLVVEGRLEALGAPGKMIQMRGDRLDNVLPDVGYDILAGQWRGIRFAPESFGNRMEYCDMRSTNYGVVVDSTADLSRQKLTLVNSWLHNSESTVLRSIHAKVDAYGCVFSEAADAVVSLTGGEHLFSQCTLSNYYLFSVISNPILSLYHVLPAHASVNPANPLMKASFNNCIIYGLASDINEGDLAGSDVFIRYTLLKAKGNDDANFLNCLWDKDPLFLTVRDEYYFNYHVKDDSPAIGAGNPLLVAPPTLSDMDGNPRIVDGRNPTLGAYAK
ncbi:MAG: hypothetical protein K2M31_05355 [Muribaculaceae bacterium]|nr:hypothetical protein [Muribaculaceae bacterium]